MLKKLLFTLSFAASCVLAMAANGYYAVSIAGGSSEDAAFPGKTSVKILGNAQNAPNNVLRDFVSSPQTIPFEFSFYGKAVTKYVVSENGYISFDTNEKTSNGDNESLPSTTAPKNAIFAFWDDLDFRQNSTYLFSINTWTYGIEGNRTHVINWFQASSSDNSEQDEVYIFSIRLHENGTFDVVHESDFVFSGKSQFTETATIGVQNEDGTEGFMVVGPDFQYPTSTTSGLTDDVIYRFFEGPQLEYDVAALGHNIGITSKMNVANKFTVDVINYGSKAVTSIDYEYTVNGGTAITGSSTLALLGTGKTQTVNINNGFTLTDGGEVANIEFTITKVNNENDGNPENNVLKASTMAILGLSADKKVLIEEFSTAPCGFCPDGAVQLDAIKAQYPDVIVVQHHAGFGTDKMTIPAHVTYASAYVTGAPTATVDRNFYSGQTTVGISRNIWANTAASQLNVPAPVKVDVKSALNDETNTLTADIDLEFIDYSAGDLRLTVFVVQKMLQGSGNGYDQRNYYSSGQYGTTHPFYLKGDPIIGYWHKDVTRAVLTDVWGDKIDIAYEPGSKMSKSFTYSVNPTKDDKSMLEIVAFVNVYNPNNKMHTVLNAGDSRVSSDISNPENIDIQALYPNPTNGLTTVELNLKNDAQVAVSVINSVGQEVMVVANGSYSVGTQQLSFDASSLDKGIYFVKVIVDGAVATQKLMVE